MDLHITFKQERYIEDDFYRKLAKDKGELVLMEESFSMKDIDKISIIENGSETLKQKEPNGKENAFVVNNLKGIEAVKNGEVVGRFFVSRDLLFRTNKAYRKKENLTRYYFVLKDREDYIKVSQSLYILESDVPKNLRG